MVAVALVLAMASPVQAGLGSALGRARNRIERFLFLDRVFGSVPVPVQPAAVAPPAAPANLRFGAREGISLELAWDPPPAAPGRTIAHYEVMRNGVVFTKPTTARATVTINPAGAALEVFTVLAVDNRDVPSEPSAAVVALRGAPVPFGIQRRTAFAQIEGYSMTEEGEMVRNYTDAQMTAMAESALETATEQLSDLEWGGVIGNGSSEDFLFTPMAAPLALRVYDGETGDHSAQILTQSEYRIRIGEQAPRGPGFPAGPMGDPGAEMPVGAKVPVRWAEVLQTFEFGEPEVLAVRQAEMFLTPEGATSPAYFVPLPERAGFVDVRLLPSLGELHPRPAAGGAPGLTTPGVLVPGQTAELALFDPIGTDYAAIQPWPMAVTIKGPPGIVRIVAIDPVLEAEQSWEAALADAIEIPSGVEFANHVAPDGRSTTGRRLVVLGLSPGVVRVAVGAARAPETWDERTITVLPRIELAVDADRDGTVTLARVDGSDRVTAGEPFRFWVNDDDDAGDVEGEDIPLGASAKANFLDETINGARDLGDFFPVYLDLGEALAVLAEGPPVTVRLKQADAAVNFAYTAMDRTRAQAHWRQLPATGYGDAFTSRPGAAETHQVTAEGVGLSEAFLAGVRDQGWGVLLLEGRSPTVAPLVLEVKREGGVVAEARLPLRLGNVEDMFRHVDLIGVPKEFDGRAPNVPQEAPATRTGDPGEAWPDALTNGNYFVFVHGYNVDAEKARGWQAEIFKRLHVLGSRARFVGVTWHGATGVHLGGGYLDYHKAVFHAFQTGDELGGALSFTSGGTVTVAAHSLGNAVVAQAIQFKDFRPAHYLMINAALPMESFVQGSSLESQAADMIEAQWVQYRREAQARYWFELFAPTDARSRLTWQSRYSGVPTRTDLHHFYSSGEDVLANSAGVNTASVIALLFRQGLNFGQGSWKMQELVKGVSAGRSLGTLALSRSQAGWSFAPGWMVSVSGGHNTGVYPRLRTKEETDLITPSEFRTKPFFGKFIDEDLTSPETTKASETAGRPLVVYDLHARANPSKSYAAAANPIGTLDQRNFDMAIRGGSLPTGHSRWQHSDFKALALPNSILMYEEVIAKGALR